MKTYKLLLSIVLLLVLGISAQAETKIAIIDLRKVFDEYFKTKAADANLKDKATELDKERKNFMDQYGKLRDDYKKALDGAQDQAVSSDEREKRKKTGESKLLELKELEQTIEQFDRQSRTSLEEQQRRMRDNILKEIQGVITTKAKTGNFSLVVDVASESFNKTPVVLYSNGENDLTTAVLKDLNSTAPVTAPTPTLK
jgi:outer membrane protein